MAAVADSALRHNVACPFCGLVCDDLSVATAEGGRLQVRAAGCHLSRHGFEKPPASAAPSIAGRDVGLDEAVARAAAILAQSRQPLFGGLGTDIDGMRAVMDLAERSGGIVDHLGTDGLFRNLRIVQDSGWMTTTLAEVRNHMDCLLIVGTDPSATFPRFFELAVAPAQTLYGEAPPTRRVFRLGPPANASGAGRNDLPVTELPCPLERLPEAVAALRCLVGGRPLDATDVAGLPVAQLRDVAGNLRSARYGVVTWVAATLEFPGAELVTQSLADLVRDLNQDTRCAAVPLGGSDNLLGANQVCTWQSGVPLRTSFAGGVPRHDSYLHATSRLLAAGDVDALVWISSFRPLAPPATDVPTVALVTADTAMSRPAEVVIPVGTPGVDHAGQVFRGDGIVAIQLSALRTSRLPTAADVLTRIGDRLKAGGARQ